MRLPHLFTANRIVLIPLLLLGWASFCPQAWAEIVKLQLLQMNDVYEITPVAGGTVGGLARVATIRNELLKKNPNTFTVLAGDLFSPSALGTAKINGDRLAGEQMVDVMNHLGLDLATFGNHEFDLPESEFKKRLAESKFQWFSGNVLDDQAKSWSNVPPYIIKTIQGKEGTSIRVGFIGVTVASNAANYVTYLEPRTMMDSIVEDIKDKTDIIIAVTHLPMKEDQLLAEKIPDIDLILGGHEHENIQQWRGKDFTPIFKADANVRTVYLHELSYDTDSKKLTIESHLQPITDAISSDPAVEKIVNTWQQKAFDGFRKNGFDPEAVIAQTTFPLDGLESSVRNHSTKLTGIITESMLTAEPDADLAIFNGGSIRIDDVLPAGAITQYDVIRILPFGGNLVTVDVKGKTLTKVLDQGLENSGTGGYLHHSNSTPHSSSSFGGEVIDPNKVYRVVTTDFLVSGKEIGLDFFNLNNPDVKLVSTGGDVRFALIKQLQLGIQTSQEQPESMSHDAE